MAKQDQDKKKKRTKRKKGIFENPLAGKPVQDPNLPDFNVEGSFNQKGYNVRGYGFKIESQNLDNLQVSYDGGKRTANIDRKTLEKGGATLIGMAPQENRQGQRVQGFNYANPNYVNAVQNNRDLQEAKRYYGVGSVGVDKRTQFENNQKKVDAVLKSREVIASLPEHLKTDKIISSIQNKPYEKTEQEKVNQNAVNSRLKRKSSMRVSSEIKWMKSNPNLGTANEIRRNLGLKELVAYTRRRRRGRWDAEWAVKTLNRSKNTASGQQQWDSAPSPEEFLIEHYKKQNLVDWGKTHGLELSDSDTGKFRTGSIAKPTYWTHNNNKRRTGTREVTQYRVGKPENEDQETIVLYDKLLTKNKEKKKQYLSYMGKSFIFPVEQELNILNTQIAEKERKVDQLKRKEYQYRAWRNTKHEDLASTKEQTALDELKKQRPEKENQLEFNKLLYFSITDKEFNELDTYKKALVTNIRETEDAKYNLQNKIIGTFAVDATTPLDDNAPKQKYIQYQKTGQDDFITPTVNKLQSQITPQSTSTEQQNLQNAIAFIEGKTRRFEVDGVKIARRDNFGRIKILDEETYTKYIKNTPSEYLRQPDKLDTTIIPELEEESKETAEKYNEVEKEYYRKERMRAQFGTTRPKGKVRSSRGGRRRRR